MNLKSFFESLILVWCLLVLEMQVQSHKINTRKSFEEECLNQHNTFRAKHGVPPLKYDQEMINHANRRAVKLGKTGVLKHDVNYLRQNTLGENIYWFSRQGGTDCRKAVKSWYDEIKDYNFNPLKTKNRVTGHFTQVVWKSTSRVGCAQVDTDKGLKGTFIVCDYAAPGNVMGQFAENVKPPRN